MTNTNSKQDLGERIERMVAEHIAASRKAAQDAVLRAFTAAAAVKAGAAPRVKSSRGQNQKRRGSAEVAALGERFYRVVCARPGETMTALCADVGASARELQRSVSLLRQSGRVRTVGNRSLMRYFPMTSGATASV